MRIKNDPLLIIAGINEVFPARRFCDSFPLVISIGKRFGASLKLREL